MSSTEIETELQGDAALRDPIRQKALADELTAHLELGDIDKMLSILNAHARAIGMSKVSKDSGITREALYKTLKPGTQIRFGTFMSVLSALGISLSVEPKNSND